MGPILTAWDLNLKQMSGAADWNVSKVLASFSFPNLQAVFSKSLSVLFEVMIASVFFLNVLSSFSPRQYNKTWQLMSFLEFQRALGAVMFLSEMRPKKAPLFAADGWRI